MQRAWDHDQEIEGKSKISYRKRKIQIGRSGQVTGGNVEGLV
jgi:hypothetical protein